MIEVPVANPGWIASQHRAEILEAVARVVDSGWYILGAEVGAFEAEFAAWVDCAEGVGVASGTDAVAIALLACGVGPGDAVLTVSHTAVATAAAIASTGAVPVLVDIDPSTYTMCLDSFDRALEELRSTHPNLRPRGVVVVHLYGHPGPVVEISARCREADLVLVEDAAQAHGAAVGGRAVGSFGDAAAFSFYPTKNLGALGDAGLVTTGSPDVAEAARLERQYGWRRRYISDRVGRNSRLDELQAAVLRALLPYAQSWNDHRRDLADSYRTLLDGTAAVMPPPPPEGVRHVYHQLVIESADRAGLAQHLLEQGIGTAVLYPEPVHTQPGYRGVALTPVELPVSERVCSRILSLPIGPHVTHEDAEHVAAAVKGFVPAR